MTKKTYFASDFHLGTDARLTSAERERQVVRWLDLYPLPDIDFAITKWCNPAVHRDQFSQLVYL